jgi:hypothetical protein
MPDVGRLAALERLAGMSAVAMALPHDWPDRRLVGVEEQLDGEGLRIDVAEPRVRPGVRFIALARGA